MHTKKLKTFEYAGKVNPGIHELEGLHQQQAFDTAFGHVVVVAASAGMNEKDVQLVGIVMERIRYYIDNADDDAAESLPANALIYSSGFLYQHGRKEGSGIKSDVSCLCMLVSEGRVYYAWVGDNICLSLWDGRKRHPLVGKADTRGKNDLHDGHSGVYLGQHPDLNPNTLSAPVELVSDDILLLGSGPICSFFGNKEIKKVIQDSMPLQTKVLRIIGQCGSVASEQCSSLMLLSFYQLQNQSRSFVTPKSQEPVNTGSTRDTLRMKYPKKKIHSRASGALKYAIIALIGILVGYMVYDLFIYDPRPPVRVPHLTAEKIQDTLMTDAEEGDLADLDELPAMPEDIVYTVRGGDTWGRIYRLYGVCSWFIINHPRNRGSLGPDNSLLAGRPLRIPVRYSGDPEFNPYYYKEFTTEIVGSRCENAGQELLDAFYKKYPTN